MNEDKFWIWIWSLVAGSIVTITFIVALFIFMGQRDLIKAGFTREMMPGYSGPQWVRK